MTTPGRTFRPGTACTSGVRDTLHSLLSDGDLYRRCALASRDAALRFLPQTEIVHFKDYLAAL